MTIAGNTGALVKAGYTFGGWNTQSDGLGDDYPAGSTISMPAANLTLYAKWIATSQNLTYNGNTNDSGTPPAGGSYATGETITVLDNLNSLTKDGHNFGGWNTAANGSGTSYAAGDTFSMPATDVTLYAVWVPDVTTYSFTFTNGTALDQAAHAISAAGEWDCSTGTCSDTAAAPLSDGTTTSFPGEVDTATSSATVVFTFTPHNFGAGFYGTYGINIDKGGSCLPAAAGGTAAAATITCTVIADGTSMTLLEIAD